VGKCPTLADCDDKDACTKDSLSGGACTLKCANTTLTANLLAKDGCCPKGATSLTDLDCPVKCGNGVVEAGETCDTAIKAGPGKCPTHADCDDKDKCTSDALLGTLCTAKCQNTKVLPNPSYKDGCCPTGHSIQTDADCLPPCGPDKTTNCVNLCKDVKCPKGQYCLKGKCVPFSDAGMPGDGGSPGGDLKSGDGPFTPKGDSKAFFSETGGNPGAGDAGNPFITMDGCNCRAGGSGEGLPSLLLIGLLLLVVRRQRQRRSPEAALRQDPLVGVRGGGRCQRGPGRSQGDRQPHCPCEVPGPGRALE